LSSEPDQWRRKRRHTIDTCSREIWLTPSDRAAGRLFGPINGERHFPPKSVSRSHDVVKHPNYRGGGRGFRVGLVSWVQKSLRCAWLEPARHRLEQQNSPVISHEAPKFSHFDLRRVSFCGSSLSCGLPGNCIWPHT
jgi:hypothetical protein